MTDTQTFVHDGTEVRKTGRVATKAPTSHRHIPIQLVEITPIDQSFTWTKWVRPEDLFIIANNVEQQENSNL